MNREADLILRCARAYISLSGAFPVKTGLAVDFDWNELERAAEHQLMMPVVATVLIRHCRETISQEFFDRLQEKLRHTARFNLAAVHEWQRVMKVQSAAGVSVISIKGPALALIA